MVEFFWFKEGTKSQETPGLHKNEKSCHEKPVRQTLVPSWAQVFAPKKQRAWPGGQCKASVHCPADVPQHHPNTDCNLQPACSIATPTAAGARTAHTPSSLTAHTASNSSFANRIPQLGGENSRFFLWTLYFYVKNVFSNATYVQCKNGPKFPLHW